VRNRTARHLPNSFSTERGVRSLAHGNPSSLAPKYWLTLAAIALTVPSWLQNPFPERCGVATKACKGSWGIGSANTFHLSRTCGRCIGEFRRFLATVGLEKAELAGGRAGKENRNRRRCCIGLSGIARVSQYFWCKRGAGEGDGEGRRQVWESRAGVLG
jgi:hypothetical protein